MWFIWTGRAAQTQHVEQIVIMEQLIKCIYVHVIHTLPLSTYFEAILMSKPRNTHLFCKYSVLVMFIIFVALYPEYLYFAFFPGLTLKSYLVSKKDCLNYFRYKCFKLIYIKAELYTRTTSLWANLNSDVLQQPELSVIYRFPDGHLALLVAKLTTKYS